MSDTFNFKDFYKAYFLSPKNYSKKQLIVAITWTLANLVVALFYLSAGASVVLASLNFIYGSALIYLYFSGILAMILAPFIYVLVWVLSLVKITHQPSNKLIFEWADALWFATLAATVIRSYLVEAYTIPTSSMEKSLLIGDFLFVSKATYGTRLPMTPLAFPFAHNTLPLTDSTKSYLEWMQMPFKRLPAFTQIKNNDVVVFNYPYENGRPTDKKENYIKRCLAISGDSIQVIGGQVYINSIAAENQPKMQTRYMVKLDEKGNWNEKRFQDMMKKFDLTEGEQLHGNLDFAFPLTMESKQALEQEPGIISVDSLTDGKEIIQNYIFPQSPLYPWNTDNFGPLYVPKAGAIVHLDSMTFPLYQHAIRVYENNPSFECKDGKYFVEGKEISTYQFKYNYYFMMGDNRHNSADSRFWGFVPETHIVGKAFFVWMSWDKNGSNIFEKIRWNRIFKFIH